MRRIAVLVAGVLLSANVFGQSVGDSVFSRVAKDKAANHKQYAIIKLDDLRARNSSKTGVGEGDLKTYDILSERGIPHSWGINQLYKVKNEQFYTWVKERHAEGNEIWHHGNKHDRDSSGAEFSNRPFESQQENFRFTQALLKEKTGITMHTFGAPYNKTDEVTGDVLNKEDDIKVGFFMYRSKNFKGLQLNNRVNLESKTGVVNTLQGFVKNYNEKGAGKDVIVLQGHPFKWTDDENLSRLTAILDFLEETGVTFITPYNYYKLQK